MSEIIMDELGKFWVFANNGEVYAGPYDTQEEAEAAHPEAKP